jgi:hypothetical protein
MKDQAVVSPREQLQNEIFDWLEARSHSQFTAPYGVIASIEPTKSGKGKVRMITFGKARSLDATLFIFSAKDIRAQAAGPLAYKLDGVKFTSKEELFATLETM